MFPPTQVSNNEVISASRPAEASGKCAWLNFTWTSFIWLEPGHRLVWQDFRNDLDLFRMIKGFNWTCFTPRLALNDSKLSWNELKLGLGFELLWHDSILEMDVPWTSDLTCFNRLGLVFKRLKKYFRHDSDSVWITQDLIWRLKTELGLVFKWLDNGFRLVRVETGLGLVWRSSP